MADATLPTSVVERVRLTSFKSFLDAELPLGELTLLVGRNGSGKSNALDALWVLSRLASGDDIRDALDGGRDGPTVRGGVAGCAPFGRDRFSLGCDVRTGDAVMSLDVEVQVSPTVQVCYEKLATCVYGKSSIRYETKEARPDSGDIDAAWNNGKRGRNPVVGFRASRLLLDQVVTRVPATNKAGAAVHTDAECVLSALRAVFSLDPVPHQMRQYVPQADTLLRRNAENLSAALSDLRADAANARLLRDAMGTLNEQDVADIGIDSSDLGYVMLYLDEQVGDRRRRVPAQLMSDGSLRFLAILVALLQAPTVDASIRSPGADPVGQTTLVIEELENGLHASQATTLVRLIRDQVRQRRIRALATAHSPALLDALTGEDHQNVVVCQRIDGRSRLTPIVQLPTYLNIVAGGGLGRAAVRDKLRFRPVELSASDALDSILMGT